MDYFHLFASNILSPAILFFVLGISAGLVKSDLKVPESISSYISIYLMMAIGFKGGAALAATKTISATMVLTLGAGFLASLLVPILAYSILRSISKLDRPTMAAIAAAYGSVSIVTFVTATNFLNISGIAYEGYMVAVLAVMEAPAIFTALYIAHRAAPETIAAGEAAKSRLARDVFTNGAILLLSGSFVIGWITGKPGLQTVEGFLVTPFQGILAFFLLDIGLQVSKRVQQMKDFSWPLFAFGIGMPIIGASLGLVMARLIGLDPGSGALLTVLCASASYIAVPAAMQLALPQAKPAIYIPMSLAITFPFNIAFGIPLYVALSEWLLL
jgi:uncharacterized protein